MLRPPKLNRLPLGRFAFWFLLLLVVHAVTSANGKSYTDVVAIDPPLLQRMEERAGERRHFSNTASPLLGPLPARASQGEEEGSRGSFDYDYAGKRLRKRGPGVDWVWIGGLFERQGSRVLCHVAVNRKRIATFTASSSAEFCPVANAGRCS